ncbi:MAG: hypothetical protein ACI9OJ_001756 [Myxococcota bacterium]|jgi:hypothetical protein
MAPQTGGNWIRSREFDLTFFIAPGLLSLLIVVPALLGLWPEDLEKPAFVWLAVIVGVDVAHVWSTLHRVYLNRAERRRRPWLYWGTPLGVYLLGTLLYATNPGWFWTALAYVAVHHFIRQQVGFMALYRGQLGESDPIARRLDHIAIYVATLGPVLWWHLHLPRNFCWFVPGDFIGGWQHTDLGMLVSTVLWPVYVATLGAWFGHAVFKRASNPGRNLTMLQTVSTWLVGIVLLNGDLIFTLTNVLIHGIPYMALVWHTTSGPQTKPRLGPALARGARFLVPLLGLAFAEEFLWDVTIMHDHPQFFGEWGLPITDTLLLIVVPLLSVPQATHYVLDAFIWRLDGSNPGLRQRLFPNHESPPTN